MPKKKKAETGRKTKVPGGGVRAKQRQENGRGAGRTRVERPAAKDLSSGTIGRKSSSFLRKSRLDSGAPGPQHPARPSSDICMINIEELLSPVSPEEPCGPDLAYDPAMQELEAVLRGKPETQFSAAEEPRWDDVRDRCIELLQRWKNLRVAAILSLGLLRTEGVPGFRDGLVLIRGLLERYWDTLYPRLDPEDNNDPTERVNILAAMLTPMGSFDDPMQFLRRLREAKLSDSPQLGKFSLEDMSPSEIPGGGSAPPADAAQVQGAFRDTPPEKLERVTEAVAQSTANAKAIDDFLTKTIGSGRAPDWAPLLGALSDISKALAPFVPQPGGAGSAEEGGTFGAGGGGKSGQIQSRQDVVRMLDRLCDYYNRAEPSSPVPLLLRRAQRLAEMNFMEIISDLSPEALGPVQNVTGVKPEAPPATAG